MRIFWFFLCFIVTAECTDSSPSFKIDPINRQFLLDGDPFQYLAGEVHYFRIPHDKWDERLKQVRALGLNAVTIPIPWNFHQFDESEESVFRGNMDLIKFIQTVYNNNLYAIVRIGPYIGAEWENGGIPWWIIRSKYLGKIRSSDPKFMSLVYEWWSHLLPKLVPLLRKNNGPILMIEIEHFYGNLGICDKKYLAQLVQFAKQHLGNDVVFFSTDEPLLDPFRCGLSVNLFPTIELFPNPDLNQVYQWFQLQQSFANGPRVASHYVINKPLLWGEPLPLAYPDEDIKNVGEMMYSINGSYSFHSIHGGSNFGFWNGAIKTYPVTTSQEFAPPILEGGEITPSYMSLKNWIGTLKNWSQPPIDIPTIPPKVAYPDITVTFFRPLTKYITDSLPECWKSTEKPQTAESINVGYGLLYYNASFLECGNLYIPQFSDNAYVFLNGNYVGTLYNKFGKTQNNTILLSDCINNFNLLEIVVEITGRSSVGYPNISKGLQSNVYINNATVEGWNTCEVPMIDYSISLKNEKMKKKVLNFIAKQNISSTFDPITLKTNSPSQPSLFAASLHIKTSPADTYLDMRGWGKGFVTINDYNIGRYWSTLGPQQTLYIPSSFLKKGSNLVMIYELEGARSACNSTSCKVKFSTAPILQDSSK